MPNPGLERHLEETIRERDKLQRTLDEERARAADDRAKIHVLAARIEQLESHNASRAQLLEDNKSLRNELEAHKVQLQELHAHIQLLRSQPSNDGAAASASSSATGRCAASITSHERILEENAHLRRDLQQSRAILARYTQELTEFMPGMQELLSHRRLGDSGNAQGCGGPGRGVEPVTTPVVTSPTTFLELAPAASAVAAEGTATQRGAGLDEDAGWVSSQGGVDKTRPKSPPNSSPPERSSSASNAGRRLNKSPPRRAHFAETAAAKSSMGNKQRSSGKHMSRTPVLATAHGGTTAAPVRSGSAGGG